MKNIIHKILRFGTLISTYGLIASVLLQIFARFFLPSAPPWTEEASRLFFIYAIAFGAGLAFENKEFIYLDWFFEKFPESAKKKIIIIIELLSCALFLVMFFYSLQFTMLGYDEYSPGLKYRMSFAFASMALLSAAMSYYILQKLFSDLKELRQ